MFFPRTSEGGRQCDIKKRERVSIGMCQSAERVGSASFKVRREGKAHLVPPYVLMLDASPHDSRAGLRGLSSRLLPTLAFGARTYLMVPPFPDV